MSALALSVLLVGAASYRFTRVITDDSISDGFRRWLYESGEIGKRWARWAYRLVSCSFCAGFWVSLGVWALWRHPWGSLGAARWLICWWAVAGVQALIGSRKDA